MKALTSLISMAILSMAFLSCKTQKETVKNESEVIRNSSQTHKEKTLDFTTSELWHTLISMDSLEVYIQRIPVTPDSAFGAQGISGVESVRIKAYNLKADQESISRDSVSAKENTDVAEDFQSQSDNQLSETVDNTGFWNPPDVGKMLAGILIIAGVIMAGVYVIQKKMKL